MLQKSIPSVKQICHVIFIMIDKSIYHRHTTKYIASMLRSMYKYIFSNNF